MTFASMPFRARVARAGGAVCLCMFALTACTEVSPTAMTSEESIAQEEAQTLQAALDAYNGYLLVDQAILADPEKDTEDIRPFVTEKHAERLIEQYAEIRAAGLTFRGEMTIDSASLMSEVQELPVEVRLCGDASGSRIENAEGQDVTPTGRDERVPLLLKFGDVSGVLRLMGSEVWAGEDFC